MEQRLSPAYPTGWAVAWSGLIAETVAGYRSHRFIQCIYIGLRHDRVVRCQTADWLPSVGLPAQPHHVLLD